MKIFVFDTETTWFSVKWGTKEQQPYIVQFAGILWTVDKMTGFTEIERINKLIRPRISIPFATSQIHWIYDKDVENAPYIEEVIGDILKYINTSDAVVGHNIDFDEEIIKWELARLWRIWDYQPIKSICTMRCTTDFCKLQGRWFSYKPPKLNELYKHLFWAHFEWAHDAMFDVEATAKILWELVKKWVIELERNLIQRLF